MQAVFNSRVRRKTNRYGSSLVQLVAICDFTRTFEGSNPLMSREFGVRRNYRSTGAYGREQTSSYGVLSPGLLKVNSTGRRGPPAHAVVTA